MVDREEKIGNYLIKNGILIKYAGNGDEIVSIPEGITVIDSMAFIGHSEIKKIIIPNSVTSISPYAFVSCTSLKTVEIGVGIKNIPLGCFSCLQELENVTVFDSIKSIDDFAFRGCTSLRRLHLLSIKQRDPITAEEKGLAFEAMMLGKPSTIDYIEEADHIPSLDRIGNYAFADCPVFNCIAIKENAIQLGFNAFGEEDEDDILSEPKTSINESEDDIFVEENTSRINSSLFGGDAEGIISLSDNSEENKIDNMVSVAIDHSCGSEIEIDYTAQQTFTEDESKKDKEYLINGYVTAGNTIICEASGEYVANAPLAALGLSTRAYNCLRRAFYHKEVMVSDVLQLSMDQLIKIRNMGAKTVSEIMTTVPEYLESHKFDSLSVDEPESGVPSILSVSKLPMLDPEIPVLAPEFTVVDGIIYNRKTYKIIQDAPVETLDLSVRSLHCLLRNGNRSISSLVGMPYNEFRDIRQLGTLSANEIQEKLEQYLELKQEESARQAVPDKTVSSQDVLCCLKENEFEAKSFNDILGMFPNAKENNLHEVLDNLVENRSILYKDSLYILYHPSFYELVQSLDSSSGLDERAIRILQMRIAGSSLEEVGRTEGITRERIRQIENRALRKLTRNGTLYVDEDKYAYFYSTYFLYKDFFFDYLGETKQSWYYLNCRYSRGQTNIDEALQDRAIPAEIRRALEKYIHRGCVEIGGAYIPIRRGEIEDYVVEKYCKDEVTLDEFFELYDRFLKENDLTDERLQVTDSMRMTRSNRLSESNRLLWKQNQRLRFYDIEGGDYTELFETLNLGQYKNIELSSRKFIVDYPELMERYDLRDEYEVHNLLKKIHAESENPDLVFGRMPNLQFGVFDRDAAVKEILFALAPVSMDDLSIMISLEYGVRPETVKANWLGCVSEYYHQGIYSIDYEDMPEEHIAILRERLTEDFYFLNELRRIYSSAIPNADLTLLSTYNLKKMGFLVGASYVIQHYSTAEAYFAHLLTDSDVVDVAPISKRYTGLTTYSAYLARLKHEMEIIEFEPFQYINIRRLQKLGFTKEKLKEYSDRVWSYLVDDDYFTIQSLKRSGFEDELDALGFGDMFYSSILKEDGRFSWQRVGGNVVLNPKGEQFTVHDFLVDRITREQSVDIDDFISDLSDIYGIFFNRSEIFEKVKGSDVYYDSIMDKLYADYATYFEEI